MEQQQLPVQNSLSLHKREFNTIRDFLYRKAGIVMNDSKIQLVMCRLEKRVRQLECNSYSDYFRKLQKPEFAQEQFVLIDLLTTNETYFFREIKHFEFIKKHILPDTPNSHAMRIWSAASSSGEEAFSLAMILAEALPNNAWEIIGTDISTRVLEKAASGLYPLGAADKIPKPLLKKYCLKGKDEYADYLLIAPNIRKRVRFLYANLMEDIPKIGLFDIIFLRNVMIYFDMPAKQAVVTKLINQLLPGGFFIISHSETLSNLECSLRMVSPSIYQKV